MAILTLDQSSIQQVARLMARLKAKFWSREGAVAQLSSGMAWYSASDEGEPTGWLLCK